MNKHLNKQSFVMGMDTKGGPTKEQLRIMETVAKEFHLDWELDFKKRLIKRKERSFLGKIRDWALPKRHTVFAMYWWLKYLYAGKLDQDQLVYMAFKFPLKHDGMPIPGYPIKYVLDGWSIPKKDRRYLTHGPLVSEDSFSEILVDDKTTKDRVVELFLKLTWPLKLILAFLSAVVTLYGFAEIASLFI